MYAIRSYYDPENLQGRFSFAAKMNGLNDDTWKVLDEDFDDGTIPAIADQTVIQWGLGMKVGDILLYQNELGDTLRLKLIAGTTPSIFQGYRITSYNVCYTKLLRYHGS